MPVGIVSPAHELNDLAVDDRSQGGSTEELPVLNSALVRPELAASFLCIVIVLGDARVTLQDVVQLFADLKVVEPATGLRFTIKGAKLLANVFKSSPDLSGLLDIDH